MRMSKLSFDEAELIVLRESVHSITIKGTDAVVVGRALAKIYKAIEELAKPEVPIEPDTGKK